MRDFLRGIWRELVPYLFVVVMPLVLIAVGIALAALGTWLPWDLLAQAGGIVAAVGVIWIVWMVVALLFNN